MRFNTPYNFSLKAYSHEEPTGVDMTLPDDSMSIHDMFRRLQSGTLDEKQVYRDGFYSDDEEELLPQNFDYSDITDAQLRTSEVYHQAKLEQSEADRVASWKAEQEQKSKADEEPLKSE